ncbi:MAG: O-antigen ligase family protein [Phycisphaerales bacterium]|nr:MAG: O-antigen ligase family protein [Phycisphaerales bacterium]
MKSPLCSIFMDQSLAERFNRAIEVLLAALLLFGPLAFGAVHAWSEMVVIVLAAAIGLIFLLKLVLIADIRFVWSWAYIPAALFVLVAVIQLLPLPSSWVAAVSPQTVALKTELLGDLPNADGILSSMTFSFYPWATKHDLRLIVAVATVFVVVVNIYREPARIKRLLATISVIGGGLALLALAQDIAGNGKIYWTVPTYDRAYSGTFINHSHYGQFMNLSMGAALALLLVTLHETFAGRKVTPTSVAAYFSSPSARVAKALVVMLVISAATVFVSLTRGGMVSMLIAAAFTTLILSSRRSLKGRGWIILLIALAAFICVLWVGFEEVYERIASLREIDVAEGGRWQIVKDTFQAWTQFPLLGTGLGTYQVVYPMFESGVNLNLATHAENEYIQTLAETGLMGVLALLAFGFIIWTYFACSVNVRSKPISSAAYGLGFGVLAIMIHSLSDFGQHLPANALLTATLCGLLVALAGTDGRTQYLPSPKARVLARSAWRLPLLVLTGALWLWALAGANAARAAADYRDRALTAERYLEADDWQSGDEAYAYLLRQATQATTAEPTNVKYRYWLNVYRWRSLQRYTDPNTGALPADVLPFVQRVAEELHQARPLCPTFGPLYVLAGGLEAFVLGDPNGAAHIRQGFELAPCDPAACFAMARVEGQGRQIEVAFERLKRAVALDGRHFQRAASLCATDWGRPDLALELAGDNAGWLVNVAKLLGGSETSGELAERARDKVRELLKQQSLDPEALASVHAAIARRDAQDGNLEAAIEHYRLALRKDYDQYLWHYQLARVLARVGQREAAIHEAEICLRLRPDYEPARQLIREMVVLWDASESPLASRE